MVGILEVPKPCHLVIILNINITGTLILFVLFLLLVRIEISDPKKHLLVQVVLK